MIAFSSCAFAESSKIKSLKSAAEAGDSYAQYLLGYSYENGLEGVEKDINLAKEWYEIDNNVISYRFQFVEYTQKNEIILFAFDRNFYIKLDNNKINMGNTKNDFPKSLYSGTWQKGKYIILPN